MKTVFHEAARDGYLDILREATRRDCDRTDEDGMTPTLWAAFHGNLDALRLLVVRGGNPDKCDLLGSSALHLAAAGGYMDCVTFLVSFGANLWCLDNDMNTPLVVASIHGREDIAKYLDGLAAKQALRNRKTVKKLKEKAVLDAQKRAEKYFKLQRKAQKRAEQEDKKLAKESERLLERKGSSYSAPSSAYSTMRGNPRSNYSVATYKSTSSEPKPYSAYFTMTSTARRNLLMGGVARKVKQKRGQLNTGIGDTEFKVREVESDGKQTIRSLSGLKRDGQVLYMKDSRDGGAANGRSKTVGDEALPNGSLAKQSGPSAMSRATSEPDFNTLNYDSGIESGDSPQEPVSLFERPGFGNVAFLSRPMTSGALLSLPSPDGTTDPDLDEVFENENSHAQQVGQVRVVPVGATLLPVNNHVSAHSVSDSIGTAGSLLSRVHLQPTPGDLPWDEDEVQALDDDGLARETPLELFLAAHGVTDYMSCFTREDIDLPALLLLSDSDLRELGLPLGPRRKLLAAVAKRKSVMADPGPIEDTRL